MDDADVLDDLDDFVDVFLVLLLSFFVSVFLVSVVSAGGLQTLQAVYP